MTSTDSIAAVRDRRAARFADLEKRTNGTAPWLRAARRTAFEGFEALGFPTIRQEAWRHTDVQAISGTDFAPAARVQATPADIAPHLVPGVEGPRLVFVNGRWSPELSTLAQLPSGVTVASLGATLASGDDARLEPHLTQHVPSADHAFTALNTAFFEDGAWIHVARGTVVERPIQLVFWTAADAPIEFHPRLLVVAEAESHVTLLETWGGEGQYFANPVTEVVVGAAANVVHLKVQRESKTAFHLAREHASLGRDSRFTSFSLALGGALARNEIEVVFEAEGGECRLNGLYAADGTQLSDNQTFVDHARPHCTSNQLYKGVLGGAARGVFNGRVLVRPDAQGTAAHQTNRNILVSEAALVDTKPQLEIHADDVRCTHGATIGRLDVEPLFYLQSRGISARDAQDILTQAFARDVVAGVGPEMLRTGLEAWIAARLAAITSTGGDV